MAKGTKGRVAVLVELEKETLAKVVKSLATIEDAMDSWKTSKDKPARLKGKVEYLGKSHSLLSSWARRSIGGNRDPEAVYWRLREFTEICREISYQKD